VEWISWLTGQRKETPTAQVMNHDMVEFYLKKDVSFYFILFS
jgi:hypothetical protein